MTWRLLSVSTWSCGAGVEGGNLAACAELGTQSYTFVCPRFSFTRVVSVWDGVILSLPYGRAVGFLARECN